MATRSSRIAVVDIGTNTLLLLVVDVSPEGDLSRVHEDCRFGRLGKGLDATGAMDAGSVARSVEIAQAYGETLRRLDVDRVAAVGTQTLREATNASSFVGPAETALGSKIEIIAGEREAQLVALSVTRSQSALTGQTFAIADVGGGSTEVIVCEAGELTSFTSLPIGSVRFAERHLKSDPPTADEVSALIRDIDSALATLELPDRVPLVGTAGTATSIASVELRLREYDANRIDGSRWPTVAVDRQLARYLELTVRERRHLAGLEPERADVIPAGIAIYSRLLHRMDSSELIVSDRGVRWGLAYELADRALAGPGRALGRSAE